MPKQNFDHKRFTETERLEIAGKSFNSHINEIAEEYGVTVGAIRYVLARPEIAELCEEIRNRKREAVIQSALKVDNSDPQGDLFSNHAPTDVC